MGATRESSEPRPEPRREVSSQDSKAISNMDARRRSIRAERMFSRSQPSASPGHDRHICCELDPRHGANRSSQFDRRCRAQRAAAGGAQGGSGAVCSCAASAERRYGGGAERRSVGADSVASPVEDAGARDPHRRWRGAVGPLGTILARAEVALGCFLCRVGLVWRGGLAPCSPAPTRQAELGRRLSTTLASALVVVQGQLARQLSA